MQNKYIMKDLLAAADSGKHLPFRLLRNWQEYSKMKKTRLTYKLLVASISESAEKLFREHCAKIKNDKTEVLDLIAYCTIIKVLRFYEKELQIISDMILEYEAYLFESSDILHAWLFLEQRPEDKLFDHRSL